MPEDADCTIDDEDQLLPEFYDHANSNDLLGWATYFGSHKTHGAWKARLVT